MYTPFGYNEAVGQRRESVEEQLRAGSPVVGLAYDGGLLLLTVRRSQRKVYEIYDRQMFSAIGNQSDIEQVRLASINRAHQEGFERSPDDVSVHRLVGFELSPALKKAFGDQWSGVPFVIRAMFAELGRAAGGDVFMTLNYDGEFQQYDHLAVIAGTQGAEDRMLERLGEPNPAWSRDEALRRALAAWILGAREVLRRQIGGQDEEERDPFRDIDEAEVDGVFLRDELKTGTLEVGLLERRTNRESRFRLLGPADLESLIRDYR